MKRFAALAFPIFLLLTIVLAAFLRLYRIGSAPKGILVDEASFGYNAYSILKTGKDEWGKSFPLVFKAFGDQKLPAYVYLDVPFIAALGLNNTAVRLPSALAGILFVFTIYILLREIGLSKWSSAFGGLAAAVSPWSIILSRFGYESNLALASFTLGLLFLFRAVRTKKTFNIVLSGIFFGATWYAYVAYRMVTILFLAGAVLFMLWKKRFKPSKVGMFIAAVALAILPLLPLAFSRTGTARFTQIGILSDPGPLLVIQEQRNYCTTHLPKTICYAIWNKPTVYGGLAIERFVSLLSPNYLFLKGDEFLTYLNADGHGQFLLILLPFYLIGIYALFMTNKKRMSDLSFYVMLGILASSIPSVLAGEPQKIRLSALLPFLLILITLGMEYVAKIIPTKARVAAATILVFMLIISSGSFLTAFLTVHIDKYDAAFNTPIVALMQYLSSVDKRVKIQVYPSFSDPIMQYAYLEKVDPLDYQKNVEWGQLEQSGFQHAVGLHNIEVTHDDYKGTLCTLYVTDRNLGLSQQALKYSVKSSNQVHTLYYVYSADTKYWCP